jgi:single-strand DNA-binding protein
MSTGHVFVHSLERELACPSAEPASITTMTDPEIQSDNHVYLRGVLAAPAAIRVLPSGDELCAFRITVRRPAQDRGRVDAIECSTTRSGLRRTALRAVPGDPIEIEGSLRRRFWRRAGGEPASRYEVDISRIRLIRSGRRRTVDVGADT